MILSAALQTAIYSALNGVITGGVYDEIPTSAPVPYTAIGEMTGRSDDDHGTWGREETVTIHVFDRQPSSIRAKTIMGQIDAALHNVLLTLPNGVGTAFMRIEFDNLLKEKDPSGPPLWRHGVLRIRARVYPN